MKRENGRSVSTVLNNYGTKSTWGQHGDLSDAYVKKTSHHKKLPSKGFGYQYTSDPYKLENIKYSWWTHINVRKTFAYKFCLSFNKKGTSVFFSIAYSKITALLIGQNKSSATTWTISERNALYSAVEG